ncbi:MAG: HTH domain-containing protein, partial [Crenarchaeota archaeon]|nr:HTH domain-containing protein [Thermoproteota archaeon]
KNLILYGPPGTGKTFHATQIAKAFTKSNSNSQIRRPIWRSVTTLVLLENKGHPLNYHEIAKRALSKNLIKTHGGTPEETIAKIMREDIDQSGSDSYFAKPSDGIYGLNIPTTIAKAAEIILYAENKPLHYTEIAQKAIDSQIVSFKGLTPEKSLLAEITKDIQTNGANSKFIQISGGTYSLQKKNPVSSITIDDNDKFIKNVTFHQSYSYEEFIEGIKPKVDTDETTKHRYINYEVRDGIFKNFCSRAAEDPENKYVMIIDEINRGNISKVFGELITVIEKDKRGSDHKVTLPYSKESFSVPKNVYVIGTMNTADRSIAKIDTALTRRFGRREIMPDSSVLKNKIVDGINLTELLDKLNNKILEISSRERQIGHSYLMDGDLPIDNISDLRLAFLYDIIPLLKELTFDDDENLRNIIGDHFIDPKTKTIKEDLTKTDEAFLKEMESFLNSNSQKNDPEETGGDVTDEEG